MRDSEYKLYVYHNLDEIDILDVKEWAHNNYHYYDGMTSPLWNKYVQDEFAYIRKRHMEIEATWAAIGAHMAANTIHFLEDDDLIEECTY